MLHIYINSVLHSIRTLTFCQLQLTFHLPDVFRSLHFQFMCVSFRLLTPSCVCVWVFCAHFFGCPHLIEWSIGTTNCNDWWLPLTPTTLSLHAHLLPFSQIDFMPAAARLDDHFHVGCCCCCSTSARPSGSFKNVGAPHFPNVGHQSTSSARTRTARCTSLAFPSALVKELTGGAVSARGRRGTELSAFGC